MYRKTLYSNKLTEKVVTQRNIATDKSKQQRGKSILLVNQRHLLPKLCSVFPPLSICPWVPACPASMFEADADGLRSLCSPHSKGPEKLFPFDRTWKHQKGPFLSSDSGDVWYMNVGAAAENDSPFFMRESGNPIQKQYTVT